MYAYFRHVMSCISEGRRPSTNLRGELDFRNLHFSYPSRPGVPVFSGLNLSVPSGSVTAVVGSSGSGKSTLPALLMRFYDPTSGVVRIDGFDLRELSPQWLRTHISIVQQVPSFYPLLFLLI